MIPQESFTPVHRIPPHNKDAEQCVLGAILQQQGILPKTIDILQPEDFYFQANKLIFTAMLALFEKSEPQDLITVSNYLKSTNTLADAGGPAYLASLTDLVPLASNIIYYSKIVREKSILRRLIATTTDIASRCYEEQDDIAKLLDEVEQTVFEIARDKSAQSFEPLNKIITRAFERVTALAERKELITGVPSGFDQFDKMTAGLQAGDLIILAGRPSMGKTALAMNIVQNTALQHGTSVGVFSLEMSKAQLGLRLLCSLSKVDSNDLRTGFIKDNDWPKLTRAAGELSKSKIFIDDTPALSVLEMRAKTRRLKAENDIGLVVVDYLQLMSGRSDSREQEISTISRSLKAMAKELDIPVIALSQLNRSLESRPNKRPQLSDLRESGAIEQDADLICFIYRDEVYNKAEDNPKRGIAELIIGKQRNGPTGTVELTFLGKYTSFENLAPNMPGYEN
ncbi:MAG: replicative DNA helicase [Proteobacteria bacterium]|nr:replicative DNA helicase [Pseudomonadota bacterium]MBU4297221.1 replicative DNA helicase [Pseudomonadota bacterium]MCG2748529.1 replicative DNA helicase [Desulfobulbaceae bacterium]